MKICRFNDDRLGLVEGDEIIDVTGALEVIIAPLRVSRFQKLRLETMSRWVKLGL